MGNKKGAEGILGNLKARGQSLSSAVNFANTHTDAWRSNCSLIYHLSTETSDARIIGQFTSSASLHIQTGGKPLRGKKAFSSFSSFQNWTQNHIFRRKIKEEKGFLV
jgi:hypothetical protein